MRTMSLPNPELTWSRRAARFDHSEIERCLGEAAEAPLELLGGGLANVNVRAGAKVVRLYRRDPTAARREAALLRRPWRTFRVPRVLREGDDFLVLEWVDHAPLRAEHGAAVGTALAEIHGVMSFDEAGDLDEALRVAAPFGDLIAAFVAHARSALELEAIAALERAAPELRALTARVVLVHGDFKLSNLHWTTDERLLVLDWEFAYAGAALSDVGQLLRWDPPASFVSAFADAYRVAGGALADGWSRGAALLDLVNLAGLLANQGDVTCERRLADVRDRIAETLRRSCPSSAC